MGARQMRHFGQRRTWQGYHNHLALLHVPGCRAGPLVLRGRGGAAFQQQLSPGAESLLYQRGRRVLPQLLAYSPAHRHRDINRIRTSGILSRPGLHALRLRGPDPPRRHGRPLALPADRRYQCRECWLSPAARTPARLARSHHHLCRRSTCCQR